MMTGVVRNRGWWFLLLGLLYCINDCDSRAVNISNTWTLPQEGFSVFYRFFRDKISWFEADAVCQFHHANLVTVENGVQFDAARAFLKELDVTEFVWIGLMRPQNTEYFIWTNSKPLDLTSGYWADPFPVMESPLCAVIDPVRDFRWHALRCGGPETAAFLCEMEVPDWASECTIRAMPSLTVQYMSDSGTVELSRDCGEEGTRHMSCRGKEDRDTILNDLTCIDEVDAADNTLKATTEGAPSLIDIHQKSVDLISKIVTDNMEDNRIDTISNKIDDQPQSQTHIEEKLNMDDLMMGDQPIAAATAPSDVYSSETKPTKKSMKKVDDKYYKKAINKKKSINKKIDSNEELMLGDQPIEDITIMKTKSGEEILPHSKKSLDLKHNQKSTSTMSSTPIETISTTQQSTVVSSSTETRLRRETEMSTNADGSTTTESVITQSATLHTESTSEEPMSMSTNAPVNTPTAHIPKITKKSFNSHQSRHKDIDFGTTPHHLREKPDIDSTNDHFIPPMLLVRTKFTSTKPHVDETTIIDHQAIIDNHVSSEPQSESSSIAVTESNPTEETTVIILDTTSEKVVTNEPLVGTTSKTITSTDVTSSESITTETTTQHVDEVSSTVTTPRSVPVTIVPPTTKSAIISEHVVESITNAPSFRQPHAPWHTTAHSTTTSTPEIVTSTTTAAPLMHTTPLTTDDRIIEIKTDTTTETILVTTKVSTSPTSIVTEVGNATTTVAAQSTEFNNPTVVSSSTPKTIAVKVSTTQKPEIPEEQSSTSTLAALSAIDDIASTEDNANHSDFTNAENYHPYRPNRRRSLTKPEVHTYIKKILG